MSKTDIKCERECERDGVRCRHYETGLGSMCGGCGDYDLWEAPPEQTERKHTPKVDEVVLNDEGIETTAYRFQVDGMTVWVDATPDGDTQRDFVDFIVLACNSHDKLVEALERVLHEYSSPLTGIIELATLGQARAALADVADATPTQEQAKGSEA